MEEAGHTDPRPEITPGKTGIYWTNTWWGVGLPRSLGQEDPLDKGMATRSSILAWRIPWTEEPGGLQSMGVPRSQT